LQYLHHYSLNKLSTNSCTTTKSMTTRSKMATSTGSKQPRRTTCVYYLLTAPALLSSVTVQVTCREVLIGYILNSMLVMRYKGWKKWRQRL